MGSAAGIVVYCEPRPEYKIPKEFFFIYYPQLSLVVGSCVVLSKRGLVNEVVARKC